MPAKPSPKAIYERMMQYDHYSKWLGIELLQIEAGSCTLQLMVRPEMLNGFELLHGGVAFALADSAAAFAANAHGRKAVSIDSQMTYAKATTTGDILIAEAKTLHKTYKIINIDVRIHNEVDELCYAFRSTLYRKKEEWSF